MIGRRGFFGALLGAPAMLSGQKAPAVEPTRLKVTQIDIAAIDGEAVRQFVQSQAFTDALVGAVQRNSHQLRSKLRKGIE